MSTPRFQRSFRYRTSVFTSDKRFIGTLTDNTLALVMSNPDVPTARNCTFAIGGGAEVALTNDTSGNGPINLTVKVVSIGLYDNVMCQSI